MSLKVALIYNNLNRVLTLTILLLLNSVYSSCRAESTSTKSCAFDGKLLRSIGTLQDVETMISIRNSAGGTPNSDSFSLGVVYFRGINGRRDPARALHYFETAATRGDVEATFITGYMYAGGDGVASNYCKAEYWYCAAGARGIEEAKYALRAKCSEFGLGWVSR
jgi:TPR repeat protein